jgi:hypothetical protein
MSFALAKIGILSWIRRHTRRCTPKGVSVASIRKEWVYNANISGEEGQQYIFNVRESRDILSTATFRAPSLPHGSLIHIYYSNMFIIIRTTLGELS